MRRFSLNLLLWRDHLFVTFVLFSFVCLFNFVKQIFHSFSKKLELVLVRYNIVFYCFIVLLLCLKHQSSYHHHSWKTGFLRRSLTAWLKRPAKTALKGVFLEKFSKVFVNWWISWKKLFTNSSLRSVSIKTSFVPEEIRMFPKNLSILIF